MKRGVVSLTKASIQMLAELVKTKPRETILLGKLEAALVSHQNSIQLNIEEAEHMLDLLPPPSTGKNIQNQARITLTAFAHKLHEVEVS